MRAKVENNRTLMWLGTFISIIIIGGSIAGCGDSSAPDEQATATPGASSGQSTPDPETPEGAYCDAIVQQSGEINRAHHPIGQLHSDYLFGFEDQEFFSNGIFEARWPHETTPAVNQLAEYADEINNIDAPAAVDGVHSTAVGLADKITRLKTLNDVLIREPDRTKLDTFMEAYFDFTETLQPMHESIIAYCGSGYYIRNAPRK